MIEKTDSLILAEILNGVVHGISTVIPQPMEKGKPEFSSHQLTQPEVGVLIGVIGATQCQLVIDGSLRSFSHLASILYGMELEGDMLESFIGEIGNMVGGNMCTYTSNEGIHLDITHPTVIVGQTKFSGFKKSLTLPMIIEGVGTLRISLLFEGK